MIVKYNVHYDNKWHDPDEPPSIEDQGFISGDSFEDCLKKLFSYYPKNDVYFFSFEAVEDLLDEYDIKDLLR